MELTINKNLMSINHTAKKRSNSDIQFIVIHYVGALGDAKANTDYYKSTYVGASADFWVGFDGQIWQGNDYRNYYSWHCGGGLQGSGGASFYKVCMNSNSVGIEMCVKKKSTRTMDATDKDWYFTDETVEAAAELAAQLMQELDVPIEHVIRHYDVTGKICPNPFVYNTGKVSWEQFKQKIAAYANTSTTTTTYYRIRKAWADSNSQIGAYTSLANAKKNCPFGYSVFNEHGKAVYTPKLNINTLTAKQLNRMTEEEKIKAVAPIYQQCQKDTGMLASVGLAQFCLESGYGTTDLAQNANNMHGMKCSLSGNSWANSTWDGKGKYTKKTQEQDINGNAYYITADFRKYPCIKDSVYDRAAYFIGAMNGSSLRYPGINKITDAVKQIEAIKKGGYATDVKYVTKLTEIVKKWNLTQYDVKTTPQTSTVLQEGSTGDDVKALQKNLNVILGTKLKIDGDFGLATQRAVMLFQTRYGLIADACVGPLTASKIDSILKGEKYSIKVMKESVRIYKSASKACAVGTAPRGTYTIVKTYKGFGKLLSGAGWINLAEVPIV
ncbi:MAG: glucosaminidase domain-containing protein [Lachnospiraceae bacterium]